MNTSFFYKCSNRLIRILHGGYGPFIQTEKGLTIHYHCTEQEAFDLSRVFGNSKNLHKLKNKLLRDSDLDISIFHRMINPEFLFNGKYNAVLPLWINHKVFLPGRLSNSAGKHMHQVMKKAINKRLKGKLSLMSIKDLERFYYDYYCKNTVQAHGSAAVKVDIARLRELMKNQKGLLFKYKKDDREMITLAGIKDKCIHLHVDGGNERRKRGMFVSEGIASIMDWAENHGCLWCYLGPSRPFGTHGLTHFKMRWGGEITPVYSLSSFVIYASSLKGKQKLDQSAMVYGIFEHTNGMIQNGT